MNDTSVLWTIVAAVAVAIALIVTIASRRRIRRRSEELKQQFGSEYDLAVEETGSPARAERLLAKRAQRVGHFQFRALNATDRARFNEAWARVQAQFVDDPAVAVSGAEQLINQVMRARGYPTEDFNQRVADLSVEHPAVVQHYRAAHALSHSMHGGQLNTEELRQAVVHYRFLFADLLEEMVPSPGSLRNAHA